MKKNIFLFSVLFCSFNFCFAQIIQDKSVIEKMEQGFAKQKALAKNRANELFEVFNRAMYSDEKQALTFLFAYMPLSDLADYNGQFFLDNIRQSLKAKVEIPWCKSIPEEVFIHFVLPVRVNNENLDSFRIVEYNELKARVKGLSMKEAALEVNHWCHEKVTYRGSDERTSSPLSTIKTSWGRCGEESTFTVAAMRTVGIPARQVYTPRWAHSDDNHAWVEVWVDGKWYFLGACEPDPDLNMGWFAGPAARAMLVHTRAYGWYKGTEPVITSEQSFSELNLIANYAPAKYFSVKVIDSVGKPVENAKVEYQLYNYAEFYPIAKTFTNKAGTTGITCGLGDLLIWANKGDIFGYKKITVENVDTVLIQINKNFKTNILEVYDFVPPVERSIVEVNETGRKENDLKIHKEDSLRTAYMKTFRDTVWAVDFAKKNGYNIDTIINVFSKSYGNWKEIAAFLESAVPANKTNALKLLSVISEKDLRDAKASILNDHLKNVSKYTFDKTSINNEIFCNHVLNGRIANEKMLAWRSFLQNKFDTIFAAESQKDIGLITDWIRKNIVIDNMANAHSRAPLTPKGVYELKVADNKSRDIFFVALCRSLNIPSRLNPETLIPQYWKDNIWQDVQFEKEEIVTSKKGFIHLVNSNPAITPKYTLNFTIAVFQDGVYRTLQFDENKELSAFPEKVEVDAGKYLLVTGNRMNDGSVLSNMFFFTVDETKTTTVNVNIREKTEALKSWGSITVKDFSLTGFTDKKKKSLSNLMKEKDAVLVFIEPDKEPTKHVMLDIAAVKNNFEKWGGAVLFILSQEKTSASFNASQFKNLPKQSEYVFDDDNILLKAIEKQKSNMNGNNYPYIIIMDKKGNLFSYSEGYKIGVGEQLVKEIARLKK